MSRQKFSSLLSKKPSLLAYPTYDLGIYPEWAMTDEQLANATMQLQNTTMSS